MYFEEIECKTALNKIGRKSLPYNWDLNVYRGCEHGCKYCFALYSHKYLGSCDYYNKIFVKANIVEQLEKKLSSKAWKNEIINLGGVTDSYQPCESRYKIMPDILNLLIKYKTPCVISTKSKLVLRDYDLIEKLSEVTAVNIACTITAMDEKIREKLEPEGAKSLDRFQVLDAFGKTRASTGLHVMPLVPLLTDNRENIEDLCYNGLKSKIDYVLVSGLNLKGETRKVFFDFISKEYPEKMYDLLKLYKEGYMDRQYSAQRIKMVNEIKEKYNLSGNYKKPLEERLKTFNAKQLSLFDYQL